MSMEIEQFDKWIKDNYSYDLIIDLEVLKKTELTTFNSDTLKDVIAIRERMTESKRKPADKATIKKYCYIHYYLMNFLKHSPDNFDKLSALVNSGRQVFLQDLQLMN